jgi:hypothetical protein
MEIGLSAFCDNNDSITPFVSKKDEDLRWEHAQKKAQNHFIPKEQWTARNHKRALEKQSQPKYRQHISAGKLKETINTEIWNTYFKFCFVRNPWDRLVSSYYWKFRNEDKLPNFDDFVRSKQKNKLNRNSYFNYTVDGEVVVDRLCRYENLAGELIELEQILNLPTAIELPHAKADSRKDKRPYQEYYSERDKVLVQEVFSRELELLGYQF